MIFETIEFYVIAAMVAAAIVAYFSRPATKGPVRQFLLAGEMSPGAAGTERSIEINCLDDGRVELTRHGVTGVGPDGAVSLAVTVKGFDVTIIERTVAGQWAPLDGVDARFVLDFLGPEWYHVNYKNEDTGQMAVLTLHVRPGIHIIKPLQ